MQEPSGTPAQTFAADTQAEWTRLSAEGMRRAQIIERIDTATRYRRKVEILWAEMIEDGLSEATALEIAMCGIVREAKERAREGGKLLGQELHDRACVLEREADRMLERACPELEAI